MSRWRGLLCGGLALACGESTDRELAGEYVDLTHDPDLAPCGDVVGHMDRYVELVAEHVGVPLDGIQFRYYWYPKERFIASKICPEGALGCARRRMAASQIVPHDHEMAHLVTALVLDRSPTAFFVEGLAAALALPDAWSEDYNTPGDADVLENVTAVKLAGEMYPLAGAFTRFMMDRYDVATYMDFYVAVGGAASLPEIEAIHRDVFGEELQDVVDAFDAERRSCNTGQSRFKLLECAGEPLAWDGRTFSLIRSLSCDDEDVVGPFFDATARAFIKLEVAEAGLYELAVAGDDAGAAVTFGSCSGCENEVHVRLTGGGRNRWELAAGHYYMQLEGYAGRITALAVRLERVE